MNTLEGTEKQVEFALKIKNSIINEINEAITEYGDSDGKKISLAEWLENKKSAKWWIRHNEYSYENYIDEKRVELSRLKKPYVRPESVSRNELPWLTKEQSYLTQILYDELACIDPRQPRIETGFNDECVGRFDYFNKKVRINKFGKVSICNTDYKFGDEKYFDGEFKAGEKIDNIIKQIKKAVF